jgi:hypothetical protein
MGQPSRARFATVQEALRFYFRAQELLADERMRGVEMSEDSRAAVSAASDVIRDYRAVARFVRGLDQFESWLLAELYGPTCFYVRERTLRRAFATARRRFAGSCARRRDLARIHRALIARLADYLRQDGLIAAVAAVRMIREAS